MTTARLGSFAELLSELPAETSDKVKAIARTLRELILADFPEATEVVRLGDGAASYGVGSKKMSESHVYIMPKAAYVNLGFWHGVNLADPKGLLEGTGKKMRHVKLRSLAEAANPALRDLARAALAERKKALGLEP